MNRHNSDKTLRHSLSDTKKSIFSSKHAIAKKRIGERLSTFGSNSTIIALGVLIVGLAICASLFAPTRSIAFSESIATFASSDCTTPKSTWNLGETACAVVAGAIVDRRITWIAPDGSIAQVSPAFNGTGSDRYTIKTGADPLAQTGTWKVESMDNTGAGFAITTFLVLDPTKTTNADLSILKFGPNEAVAGNTITYTVQASNKGPDAAQSVVITEGVPNNSTFVSESQNSGPTATCVNPNAGATGTSTCTIPTLNPGDVAIFTFVFNVNPGTAANTVISNTASVSSSTNELFQSDNTATYRTLVVPTASAPPCTITCPANVTASNQGASDPCNVVVTYSSATLSGNCVDPDTGQTLTVACSPPSGSTFPVGSTAVTCAAGGNSCAFTVTVTESRSPVQPTITCPSNQTVNEQSPGFGSAIVSYPQPTTTGNCVTVNCSPPSGSSFPVGTTTVNCTGTDSANTSVSCSFTVTVNSTSGAGCTITCPSDVVQPADPNSCSAVVNYPLPTVSGPCGTVSCTPPSGSTFQAGSTQVTCVVSGGPSCSFTVTVTAPAPPTITACAANRTVSVNANCEAAIPNMVGGVQTTGCSVTVTQSPAAGTILGPGTYTVTFTAENSAGQATCTATVTLADTTPPVITTCPAPTSASANANCQAAVPDVTGGVVATDNCTPAGSLVATQNPAAGTLVGPGQTTITITVKDAANNAATCTTTFTVNDTTPPTAVCKNITVFLDANGNASISGADVDGGSTDNCGIVSRTVSPNTFTCANKGANTVTLTVKDAANNSATCQATVTVVDNIPPTISCPANIVKEPTCPSGAIVNYATPVGTDNCPGAVTVQTAGLASGSIFPIGTTTNTFKVTDTSGNFTTCSFTVHVESPAEVIQDLINRVQALINQGVLNQANGQGLLNKLQPALDNVNSGNTAAACDNLDSFIDKVSGYIQHGTLTSAQGQPLIDSAKHAQNGLGCKPVTCT